MGIFDKLKSTAKQAVNTAATSAVSAIGSKRETFTFTSLPESLAELQALPEGKNGYAVQDCRPDCPRALRLRSG